MENPILNDSLTSEDGPMNTSLQINASLFGESGQSSRLSAEFAATLAASTGSTLVVREQALAAAARIGQLAA